MSVVKRAAIVTGGGTGMGAATARLLVQRGWSVTIFGRRKDKLDEVLRDIDQDINTLAVPGDVSNREDVQLLIDAHLEKFGRLDGLVNNAAIVVGGPIGDVSLEDWKKVMAVNVDGVFNMINLSIEHLKKVKGSIVNVSSVSGVRGEWAFSPYCASKGAVTNFTHSLALELGGQGVRINAVAPALTDTDMASFVTGSEEMMAMMRNRMPLGRAAKPSEIAAPIVFLLSDDASFINGAILPVDGGVMASSGQPNFTG
ncbi:SDR family NAD(P)-dependent oxidoreductase [Pseudoteredinibacter isoporae]|uniref:Meso-butanediol dehydrogenase/(S,S)-butanediol dehydrogenase/diacetyl reductase n=1 Tax=Pseudoteredinibacter isoporae TaxID=570281 RepID=A0A7X0JVZ6_9GAMM|nr:SDR family oxidoreductase [Pseudoteredinibacter isoporae]MBB6522520.1 meso-butanediol dehydrogenase/(S,S)-butanediol dehydrogenase/diacetyl reductase [Pseudoteredinibacter isoporae]NHO88049.1 SDR family oxidoreductase [Pseudoteredinibacter isoporae]NIB23620.1 SDR family oxidoreductase [Pseudoteredinibacter isoporae]